MAKKTFLTFTKNGEFLGDLEVSKSALRVGAGQKCDVVLEECGADVAFILNLQDEGQFLLYSRHHVVQSVNEQSCEVGSKYPIQFNHLVVVAPDYTLQLEQRTIEASKPERVNAAPLRAVAESETLEQALPETKVRKSRGKKTNWLILAALAIVCLILLLVVATATKTGQGNTVAGSRVKLWDLVPRLKVAAAENVVAGDSELKTVHNLILEGYRSINSREVLNDRFGKARMILISRLGDSALQNPVPPVLKKDPATNEIVFDKEAERRLLELLSDWMR